MTERKEMQDDLIYKVGLLLAPIVEVANDPEAFDKAELRRRRARFHHDMNTLKREVRALVTGEAGATYEAEWEDFFKAYKGLLVFVDGYVVNDAVSLQPKLDDCRRGLIRSILAVPVSTDATVLEAKTPFSTYCKLRELFASTADRLLYVDRYVDADLFHRYFRHVGDAVKVTIVTWPSTKLNGKRAETQRAEFRNWQRVVCRDRWIV